MKIDPRLRHAGRRLKATPKGKVLVIPMQDLDAMLRLLRIIKREDDFSLLVTRRGLDSEAVIDLLKTEFGAKAA